MFGLGNASCISTLEFTSKQLADVFRFNFTESRPHNSWFLVFSGKLHDANMSGMVSMIFEDAFVENDVCEKRVFDIGDENVVFGEDLEFVLPRMMFMLDNNFQTALYFTVSACQRFWNVCR